MDVYTYGPEVPLRFVQGPVSFGWMVAAANVSWSRPDARDLLISRCWRGLFLYPSTQLSDGELSREPIQLLDDVEYLTRGFPCDWNRDGVEDLLLTDRPGFIYRCERAGDGAEAAIGAPEVLRDSTSGLPFNVPSHNPTVGQPDNEGGYIDPDFYCYTFPVVYPRPAAPGGGADSDDGVHLLVGDSAGWLWWLEDDSAGGDRLDAKPAAYSGEVYRKPESGFSYGMRYRQRHGLDYVRPRAKALDHRGQPLLVGHGAAYGRHFAGGWVKPVLVRNPDSGALDLLVLSAGGPPLLLYLRHLGFDDNGVPMFADPVEVPTEGVGYDAVGNHGMPVLDDTEQPRRLFIPQAWKLAVLRWEWAAGTTPRVSFDHTVAAADARACAYNITEIVEDGGGGRWAVDCPNGFQLHRLTRSAAGEARIDAAPEPLNDQNGGEFRPEGQTDQHAGSDWGLNRLARWRFRAGDDRPHFVVGSDAGQLYLLVAEEPRQDGKVPRYRSVGPLSDAAGQTIKLHNRAVAAGLDMTGAGHEDLVVAAASYQMGIQLDPRPGAGLYLLSNLGSGADDAPLLAVPVSLAIEGLDYDVDMNQNLQLQSLDLDGDGRKELIVSFRADGYVGRICRPSADGTHLVYTGNSLPRFGLHDRILDVDGDGALDYLFSGGETGLAHYCALHHETAT